MINIRYKSGPKTDPYVAPDLRDNGSEQIPLILILMVLLTRKLSSVLHKSSVRLKLLNIL